MVQIQKRPKGAKFIHVMVLDGASVQGHET